MLFSSTTPNPLPAQNPLPWPKTCCHSLPFWLSLSLSLFHFVFSSLYVSVLLWVCVSAGLSVPVPVSVSVSVSRARSRSFSMFFFGHIYGKTTLEALGALGKLWITVRNWFWSISLPSAEVAESVKWEIQVPRWMNHSNERSHLELASLEIKIDSADGFNFRRLSSAFALHCANSFEHPWQAQLLFGFKEYILWTDSYELSILELSYGLQTPSSAKLNIKDAGSQILQVLGSLDKLLPSPAPKWWRRSAKSLVVKHPL